MRGVMVHAALLAVALLAATATWRAQGREPADEARIVVWERGARELVGVLYRDGEQSVQIERRGTGADSHLWARETMIDWEAVAVAGPAPAGEPVAPRPTRTEEYPVGDRAAVVFERLAGLMALRDLGAADPERRASYGLADDSGSALTVRFSDGTERGLLLGTTAFGGGGRYALELRSERIYVLPTDLLGAFESGGGTLRLTEYHGFRLADVASVTARSAGAERTLQRRMVDTPPRPVWVPLGADREDVAFRLFMDTVDRLWLMGYVTDLAEDALEPMARLDYQDARGRPLGFVELFRGRDAAGETRYYMRSARTIAFAEIHGDQGQRLERDVESVLRAGAPGD